MNIGLDCASIVHIYKNVCVTQLLNNGIVMSIVKFLLIPNVFLRTYVDSFFCMMMCQSGVGLITSSPEICKITNTASGGAPTFPLRCLSQRIV